MLVLLPLSGTSFVLFTYLLLLFIPLFNLMFFCYYVLVSLHLPVQVSLFTVEFCLIYSNGFSCNFYSLISTIIITD